MLDPETAARRNPDNLLASPARNRALYIDRDFGRCASAAPCARQRRSTTWRTPCACATALGPACVLVVRPDWSLEASASNSCTGLRTMPGTTAGPEYGLRCAGHVRPLKRKAPMRGFILRALRHVRGQLARIRIRCRIRGQSTRPPRPPLRRPQRPEQRRNARRRGSDVVDTCLYVSLVDLRPAPSAIWRRSRHRIDPSSRPGSPPAPVYDHSQAVTTQAPISASVSTLALFAP